MQLKRHKINIAPYGENFIIVLVKIKFKIWRVTFLRSFLPLKKFLDGLPVFTQETIYHMRTEMRQSLGAWTALFT